MQVFLLYIGKDGDDGSLTQIHTDAKKAVESINKISANKAERKHDRPYFWTWFYSGRTWWARLEPWEVME